MRDYDYKYDDPTDSGCIRFKLTKKQHNEIFKNRKIKWPIKYEHYHGDNGIRLHRFVNWQAVLITTVLFPVIILLEGVVNFKDVWKELKKPYSQKKKELKKLYNQKKSGSFSEDFIPKDSKAYAEVMEIINTSK